MKRLFLTSAIGTKGVAASVRARIGGTTPLKTIFITTPVEPESEQVDLSWYETDRTALRDNGFNFRDYTITGKSTIDLQRDLKDTEVIYVSGGNTNHLLEQSQRSGFSSYVSEFIRNGGIYVSTSAGSIITGKTIPPYLWRDEKGAPNLSDFSGYKLVNFTVIPHWGSSWFKDLYLNDRMEQVYSTQEPYILLNDYEYLEVLDDQFYIFDVRREQ